MSIDHSMTLRLFVGLLCSVISTFASELYSTDFSDFPVGEDQLVGHDGWEGTNIGQGVHGIDAEAIAGIGQSAYLGAIPPTLGTEAVSVFRPLASPVTSEAVVEFQTVFGIATSTQSGEDIFTFTFYNADDDYLAAIQFDTTLLDYGIWQDDGSEAVHTGESFEMDVLYLLTVTIDLPANRWSADLDGLPIFTDADFTRSDVDKTLGSVAAEWILVDVNNPGDNWLLFDDWSLEQVNASSPMPPFAISSIARLPAGEIQITWEPVEGTAAYRVQHSEDGILWRSDLPGADRIPGTDSETSMSFVDETVSNRSVRFYRVQRFE